MKRLKFFNYEELLTGGFEKFSLNPSDYTRRFAVIRDVIGLYLS